MYVFLCEGNQSGLYTITTCVIVCVSDQGYYINDDKEIWANVPKHLESA